MEAYCVKCKTKREVIDPEPVFTQTGAPATKGVCPVCGTTLFRMGRTEAHAGLQPDDHPAKVREKRSGKLVIVESPAKARTVGRFLGKGYTVKASVGHVRDLLRSQLSVDVEHDFAPKYRVPKEKRAVVKELKDLASKAEEIYLATDPDREGEAIAWHLLEAANIDPRLTQRVVFHEITEPAVAEAFAHPRDIDMDLVDAQQARRVLDRLVGYNLSPLLWRKVRGRLSAGRVQSVALRLVVDREREIDAFVPGGILDGIEAEFRPEGGKDSFIAKLAKIDGEDPVFGNEAEVSTVSGRYGSRRPTRSARSSAASDAGTLGPFITSTLQQEASRKLGYTARRTMALAQQLYEGIDMGEGGSVGLITYMRTDSTNVSELAQAEARQFISGALWRQVSTQTNRPSTRPRRRRAGSARGDPPHLGHAPARSIKEFLNRDQFRLYQLIWQRFVASQMSAAVFDTLSVEVYRQTACTNTCCAPPVRRCAFPGF